MFRPLLMLPLLTVAALAQPPQIAASDLPDPSERELKSLEDITLSS